MQDFPEAVIPFYTYMLRCSDGSYYVGHTDDLDRRVHNHDTGICGGYTSRRRPVTLVWAADHQSRTVAFAMERQIKGWSRAKKEALMCGDFDALPGLARGRSWSKPRI